MRRSDKQITDPAEIETIIRGSSVCRLAFCDAGQPYLVPLSFGYRNGTLYFHSAREGKKIDILRSNDRVCFEFDLGGQVVKSGEVCNWGVAYRSVIGTGRAVFIEDLPEKRHALAVIIDHYGGKDRELPLASVNNIAVFAVRIEEMSGKQAVD